MSDDGDTQLTRPCTSTREREALREQLRTWLACRLGPGTDPQVSELDSPDRTGMSSETLLFDLRWHEGGTQRAGSYVARLHPTEDSMPVFPVYDFDRQVRVMRLVAERSAVPVPRVSWFERDREPLGSPFFIMERIDGVVAPDMLPYTCGSWLSEASPSQQASVRDDAIDVLAGVHSIVAKPDEVAFLEFDEPGATPLRRHFAHEKAYYAWVRGDWHCPIVERTFAWLESKWPVHEGEPVVNWGDARLGNILWHDFRSVAVLDWETAAWAPREVDLGWMIFFQKFYQSVAEQFGQVGMPTFMRRDDVATGYAQLAGYEPQDLDWFIMYAALRQSLVSLRTGRRTVHFGEQPMPDDPQHFIYHRNLMKRALDGTSNPWA